jgi:hypothetical protein
MAQLALPGQASIIEIWDQRVMLDSDLASGKT